MTASLGAQMDDPDSAQSHYRRLIRLRHDDPAVVDGDFTLLSDSYPQIFAFRRRHESGQLVGHGLTPPWRIHGSPVTGCRSGHATSCRDDGRLDLDLHARTPVPYAQPKSGTVDPLG